MSQFGILLTQNCSWAELQTHARKVEELGFNSLWVADSFANPFIETEWLEGWTTLAGLSQATQSIRIGTLVTNIVYRHPAIIAKQAITVDHMSNGRLELGLGAGGVPTDHSMTGTPMWTGKERQARFAEFVTVVNKLLTQETSSFSGEYYSFEDAYVSPPPHQQPILPLVIAAHGPKSMRLAARYASKWSFSDPGLGRKGKEAAAAIREMNNYLDDQLRSVGRNPEEITRSFCCGYCAATMWSSLDEALSSIELFEAAGVNEFILTYAPDPTLQEETMLEAELAQFDVSLLFRTPDDLSALAHALLD